MKTNIIITNFKGSKIRVDWVEHDSITYTLFNGNNGEEWAYLRTYKGSENFNLLKATINLKNLRKPILRT